MTPNNNNVVKDLSLNDLDQNVILATMDASSNSMDASSNSIDIIPTDVNGLSSSILSSEQRNDNASNLNYNEKDQLTPHTNPLPILHSSPSAPPPSPVISSITSNNDSNEFIIFKNQLDALINNNLYILKECKSNKRLLDLKYATLTKKINYIQISVIVLSTLSGFLQSTKEFFSTPETGVTVTGISISTYISLILSVSKYYKFDEKKETIHNLREKYSGLHNKIEYRMDILGPWTNYKLWDHQDHQKKLQEWNEIMVSMEEEYLSLIETKQALVTEFEIIMDSKSRNKYNIRNKELVLFNREKLFNANLNEWKLEGKFKDSQIPKDFKSSIELPDDDLNNWDDVL